MDSPVTEPQLPRHAVVILLDSLNRHLVGAYGGTEFDTPNLDRFARRALRFTNHHAGSLPCMPARHDLLCGSLDFLWRPWGSVEVWEDALPHLLRRQGITSYLISDHPHLFETGGENYHTEFSGWWYERGHEDDPWHTVEDPSAVGAPHLPAARPAPIARHYDTSRSWFRTEAEFPGPRTMAAAARWLRQTAGRHDRSLLVVDEFDPHEPFDTPEPWASRYDATWDGPRLIWPPYLRATHPAGVDPLNQAVPDERESRQLRANYGAKLSMIDHWFGQVLDALDERHAWDDTVVIVTTDHGHYLGEHGNWGKPGSPVFATLGHIPLLVAWPGRPAADVDALTTSVDLFATLADLFGVTPEHRTHGRSLVPLLTGAAAEVRPWLLCGVWGREVHVISDDVRYGAAPAGDNAPLSMWSNRWSTMPVHAFPQLRLPRPDGRAVLARMPDSDVPVIRQPFVPGDLLPFWAGRHFEGNHLYLRREDPYETANRAGDKVEADARELLRHALTAVDAPDDQLLRLGLG